MAGKRYEVFEVWVTVKELADACGVKENTVYHQIDNLESWLAGRGIPDQAALIEALDFGRKASAVCGLEAEIVSEELYDELDGALSTVDAVDIDTEVEHAEDDEVTDELLAPALLGDKTVLEYMNRLIDLLNVARAADSELYGFSECVNEDIIALKSSLLIERSERFEKYVNWADVAARM